MAQTEINFGNGQYYFNHLTYLFTDTGIDSSYLVDDILQIDYGKRCVDVGSHGNKILVIKVIADSDWEKPLYKKVIRKIERERVFKEINKAIELLHNLP